MTSLQAYASFIQQVNRNAKGDNISVDKETFVTLYNEMAVRRVDHILDKKNDDDLREIQAFLITKSVTTPTTEDDRDKFQVPDDYFDISSVTGYATKGSCKNRKLLLWPIKDNNRNEIVFDEHNEPSFEYEEAPYIVADGTISVFKTDFKVDKIKLSYYRRPKKIDLAGYTTEEGVVTTQNIDPDGDERFIHKVVAMCAEEVHRNDANIQSFQLSKDKVSNNL